MRTKSRAALERSARGAVDGRDRFIARFFNTLRELGESGKALLNHSGNYLLPWMHQAEANRRNIESIFHRD